MELKNAKKEFGLPFLIAFLFLLWSFVSDHFFASGVHLWNGLPLPFSKVVYLGSKILYFGAHFLIWSWILQNKAAFIEKFRSREWRQTCLWIALPWLTYIVLSWPGVFNWDEYWGYWHAVNYHPGHWQSYHTDIYYILALNLFPSAASFVIVQVLFFIAVASYLVNHLTEVSARAHQFRSVFIALLVAWPTLVMNNLGTYRSSQIAILEMFLLVLLFTRRENIVKSNVKLGFLALLTVVTASWRTEAAFHVLLVPLCLYFTTQSFGFKKFLGFFAIAGLATLAIAKVMISSRYEFTAYMNPLSQIVANPKADLDNVDMTVFNHVIDTSCFIKNSRTDSTPCFNPAVKDFSPQELQAFKVEYRKLVAKNMGIFLVTRLKTFIAASGFTDGGSYLTDTVELFAQQADRKYEFPDAFFMNPLNFPITALRVPFVQLLESSKTHPALAVFWNVIPIFGFMILIFIRNLRRIRSPFFWAPLLILSRGLCVFMAAPASFFMYYYPCYLGGLTVCLFYVSLNQKKQ